MKQESRRVVDVYAQSGGEAKRDRQEVLKILCNNHAPSHSVATEPLYPVCCWQGFETATNTIAMAFDDTKAQLLVR
jgi:hypothetical protein